MGSSRCGRAGADRPLASNLNLVAGQTTPNLVITKIDAGGNVCLFTQRGADLVADVAGYFPAASTYQPLVPERLLDTRAGASQVGYTGGKPGEGAVVTLHVTGVGTSNIPANASAVVLNVTGVDAAGGGFITVWPCGADRPLASNLNVVAGQTTPNLVITKIDTGGNVCLFTQRGADLVADVAGYFPGSTSYQSLVPERLLDTRASSQVGYTGVKPAAGAVVTLHVTGVGASNIPANASAVVLNVTGVDATGDGFITVWPCGADRPLASNLNVVAGQTTPNLVITKIDVGGNVCLFTQRGADLVADVAGYFP